MSRLTNDNSILIEFDSFGCYINDKATGKLLLEGQMQDGLYEFKKRSQSCFSALHSNKGKDQKRHSAVTYPSSI